MSVRGVPADAGCHRYTSSRGRRRRSAEVIATRDEGERGVLGVAVARSGLVRLSSAGTVRAKSAPPLLDHLLLQIERGHNERSPRVPRASRMTRTLAASSAVEIPGGGPAIRRPRETISPSCRSRFMLRLPNSFTRTARSRDPVAKGPERGASREGRVPRGPVLERAGGKPSGADKQTSRLLEPAETNNYRSLAFKSSLIFGEARESATGRCPSFAKRPARPWRVKDATIGCGPTRRDASQFYGRAPRGPLPRLVQGHLPGLFPGPVVSGLSCLGPVSGLSCRACR